MSAKPYIGQDIYNSDGKLMGKIVRIHDNGAGDTILYFVPIFTPVSFGNAKYYRSSLGEVLDG